MKTYSYLLIGLLCFGLFSCRSTKKIQSAISKKDTSQVVMVNDSKFDSAGFIKNVTSHVDENYIDYNTFSAKVKVDYRGGDGKSYDFNAFLRMKKDSVIWVSINAALGIEAFRILIKPDSVFVLNKLDKVAQLRSLNYLRDVTQLPIDFHTLQEIIIGNPVYFDRNNIVSVKIEENVVSLTSIGSLFKNFITFSNGDYLVRNSKLDDRDGARSRTAVLTYDDYESKGNTKFSTKRKISVAEKTTLSVSLDYKQFDFNENLNYPFSIPKNYDRN
jgi:uncharacterized protein DUF4292